MYRRHPSSAARGFTLIELLVVIGIIVLLISILIPVVSHVRMQSFNASTQAQMQRIMQACESYYHDFNAYPGPIANANLMGGGNAIKMPFQGVVNSANSTGVTSSENLVLGLLGFLTPPTPSNPAITFVPAPDNVPPPSAGSPVTAHDVCNLSQLHPGVPSYHYIDYVPGELSRGLLNNTDGMTTVPAKDTNVPEFIDRFPDPLPILYIRANVGGNSVPPVAPGDVLSALLVQYNFMELSAYGINMPRTSGTFPAYLDKTYLGASSANSLTNLYSQGALYDSVSPPFADWDGTTTTPPNGYLMNPNIAGSPRGKDGFILIGAGIDRTYGTSDDILITP